MQILGLLGMYFDAVVVEAEKYFFFFRLWPLHIELFIIVSLKKSWALIKCDPFKNWFKCGFVFQNCICFELFKNIASLQKMWVLFDHLYIGFENMFWDVTGLLLRLCVSIQSEQYFNQSTNHIAIKIKKSENGLKKFFKNVNPSLIAIQS